MSAFTSSEYLNDGTGKSTRAAVESMRIDAGDANPIPYVQLVISRVAASLSNKHTIQKNFYKGIIITEPHSSTPKMLSLCAFLFGDWAKRLCRDDSDHPHRAAGIDPVIVAGYIERALIRDELGRRMCVGWWRWRR